MLAWREALERASIELSVWRIHRSIGMSGGLLVNAFFRETGREISPAEAERLQGFHAEAYARRAAQVRPFPGAPELLAYLERARVPHAIATSGRGTARRLRSRLHRSGRQRLGPAGRAPRPGSRLGLLSGGYGQEKLEKAGAYRVYQDPGDLLAHLDEIGVRVVE